MKTLIASIVFICLFALGSIGWVKCVIHLIKTDFAPPYKAEVIYGIGSFTGIGAVVGWINIKD